MNLTSLWKHGLAILGVTFLAVAGLVAWTHRTSPPPTPVDSASANPAALTGNPEPVSRDFEPPPPVPSAAPLPEASSAPAPMATPVVVRRHRYYRTSRRRYVVRRRPFSHSVAIVAGSAGAGALVGGLAGGGKGAGIGALAGGAGGLVYDRLTHRRRVRVRR